MRLKERIEDQKRISPDVLRITLWDEISSKLEAITRNAEEIKDTMTEIATNMIKVPEVP